MFSFGARCSTRATFINSHLFFRSVSKVTPRTKPIARPPVTSLPSPKISVDKGRVHRLQIQANQILQAGRNEIYRNTAATGFVATSSAIAIMSYGCIGYLYSTKLWRDDVAKERGLAWYVPKAYQVTMIAWGLLAAYALGRTLSIVTSIKIVKLAEKTQLELSVRRGIPFRRAEKVLVDPDTLLVNRARLYGSAQSEEMITAPEGESLVTRITRSLFYMPFHNTRKALGGVGLVPIRVGPTGEKRHFILDADGQFSKGGQDLLELSEDDV